MAETNPPKCQEESQSRVGVVTRRDLLYAIGSMPAVSSLAIADLKESRAQSQGAAKKSSYTPKIFDEHQWRTVRVLCDLIIPADERSGSATDAGVPEFIDDWIDFQNEENGNNNEEAQILGGLMWLDRQSNAHFEKVFSDASPAQQKQILDRIAWPARAGAEYRAWVLFFNHFRDLTVSGFFSSKMGVADLPYLGNTAVAKWEGCPPKVWAIIEDRLKNGFTDITREARSTSS